MDSAATGIVTVLGFLTLALIFRRFNHISGWTLWEVAFLYGMVEAAFGTMDMFFSGFDPQNFGKQIRLGLFDQILLRPVNATVQVLASDFILRRLGRIIQGLIVLGLAFANQDVQWTLGKILYLPVIFVSLVMFFGGLFVIGATITFWTVESIEIINVFTYGGSEMMSYPMHIYQDWMRRFFTYVLPGIFIVYYPALFILGKPDPFHMPQFAYFLSPVAGFSVLLAASVFWQFGVRHYQSTGT
ncbi:MAG: ABC transporter permease [Chloroflexi bacterium]|nr:MAG: ABC transporter permease [Chloroflexota bacterium]